MFGKVSDPQPAKLSKNWTPLVNWFAYILEEPPSK